MAKNFTELLIWHKAKKITVDIYSIIKIKDYPFLDQIRKASISIMNNISEGFTRQNPKEFHYFLNIAKASAAEVLSMLYLALDLKYINRENFTKLQSQIIEIIKILQKFKQYLK